MSVLTRRTGGRSLRSPWIRGSKVGKLEMEIDLEILKMGRDLGMGIVAVMNFRDPGVKVGIPRLEMGGIRNLLEIKGTGIQSRVVSSFEVRSSGRPKIARGWGSV